MESPPRKLCALVLAITALLTLLSAGLCFSATIHDGKDSMRKELLEPCVKLGIYSTGYIVTPEEVALLMETAAAESRLGKYDIKNRCKGSHGIFQIVQPTAKDTLEWLKKRSWKDWAKLMEDVYVQDLSLIENLETNVEFSAAVAWLIYARMAPKADLSTREKRAAVWKRVYNTSLGAGTEEAYLKRCKECLDDPK